jgi:hypothetical protein
MAFTARDNTNPFSRLRVVVNSNSKAAKKANLAVKKAAKLVDKLKAEFERNAGKHARAYTGKKFFNMCEDQRNAVLNYEKALLSLNDKIKKAERAKKRAHLSVVAAIHCGCIIVKNILEIRDDIEKLLDEVVDRKFVKGKFVKGKFVNG